MAKLKYDTFSILTILSAGLFWSSVLLQLGEVLSFTQHDQEQLLASQGLTAFIAIATFAYLLISRKFSEKKVITISLLFTATSMLIEALLSGGHIKNEFLISVSPLMGSVGPSFMVLLLGARFASMDTEKAVACVTRSVFIALMLFLLFLVLPDSFSVYLFIFLILLSELCIFASSPKKSCEVEIFQLTDNNKKGVLSLFLLRVFFGLSIGIVTGLQYCQANGSYSNPIGQVLAIISCVLMAIFLTVAVFFRNSIEIDVRYSALVPMIALGIILVPFIDAGFGAIAQVAGIASWMTWIILSSVQISNLKDTLSIDSVALSSFEKAIVLSLWFFGHFLGAIFYAKLEPGLNTEVGVHIATIVFAFISVLLAAAVLIKHLFVTLPKQQEISSDNVRKAIVASCEAIARNYGLTHREGEVLVYLASGYSRPYIENTLCISGGTVRTHVNHIHQKLRIHSRQQLLDIVQEFNDLN